GARRELGRSEPQARKHAGAALRPWRATRAPGDGRLPTLTQGLRASAGRVDGGSWRIEALAIELPQLRAAAPVRARTSGRYVDASMLAPFDLAATLQRPASGRGFAVVGAVAPARAGWRLPAGVEIGSASCRGGVG